jgi:hypothetical protein
VTADAGNEWIIAVESLDRKVERIWIEAVHGVAELTFPVPSIG